MVKTKRIAITLALGILLVLFSTAFATAPAKARMSRTASAPTTSQQVPAVWSGWGEVPGNGSTLSGPATTYNGNEYVFVRGTNNRIYMNASNGTTWSGWREVPGHGLTPSAPAATSGLPTVNAGNTLYLFDRGTDNKIYVNTFNGATWSGWSEVAGNGFTPDAPGAMAFATSASVGQVDLFVRGTNDRIYMNSLRFG